MSTWLVYIRLPRIYCPVCCQLAWATRDIFVGDSEGKSEGAAILWPRQLVACLLDHLLAWVSDQACTCSTLPWSQCLWLLGQVCVFSTLMNGPCFYRACISFRWEETRNDILVSVFSGAPIVLIGLRLFLVFLTLDPSSFPTVYCMDLRVSASGAKSTALQWLFNQLPKLIRSNPCKESPYLYLSI